MRPLTVVTLIILGSCFAIMVSLGAVLIVSLVHWNEPRLQREFVPLLRSFSIFVGMTAICGLSFYSLLKNSRARYWAQAAMWAGILLTGWYYGS
ncbi:MAG: hypothetical protein OEW73_04535 [Gammaproteobacteria bacterium]|nr:hypothetical protein [Gammaproteobacteria bacterium]MDH5240028.1 hypothetical protein [Gammaproteobacteria bacterium]MDH5262346.1 hypothetical protein [Gammaproteobacteria bacterium]